MRSIAAAVLNQAARLAIPRWQELWTSEEADAVSDLVASKEELIRNEYGGIDTATEEGNARMNVHLEKLDAAGCALGLAPFSRRYRQKFTSAYRKFLPDQSRNYQAGVFEASAEQEMSIWMNGSRFELSEQTMRLGAELQRTWAHLDWQLEIMRIERPWSSSDRPELRSKLAALDRAWARFEQRYINDLMEIEKGSRSLVQEAVEADASLRFAEAVRRPRQVAHDMVRQSQSLLVEHVSRLNSVANFKRKGRSDLDAEVLRRSEQILATTDGVQPSRASRALAADVVASWAALRGYLRQVESCLDRLDPHLRNNPGLVTRLVDWEESWEVATQYLLREDLHTALCALVDEIRGAQEFAPALAKMFEDCEVELFLVLPRIVWLSFFLAPGQQAPLIQLMLPDCFQDAEGGAATVVDEELRHLMDRFGHARQLLLSALKGPDADRLAWEVLVGRAVAGADAKEVYGLLRSGPAPARRRCAAGAGADVDAKEVYSQAEACTGKPTRHGREALSALQRGIAPRYSKAALASRQKAVEASMQHGGRKAGQIQAARYRPHGVHAGQIQAAQQAVEAFMGSMERWSIELQRRCPSDWNLCSAVVVQCLSGEPAERTTQVGSFMV